MKKIWKPLLIIVIIIAFLASIASSLYFIFSSTPLTESEKHLQGKWVNQNGNFFNIYSNGKGSLKFSGTSMEGVTVNRFKEPNIISFDLGPIKKKLVTDGTIQTDSTGAYLIVNKEKFYKLNFKAQTQKLTPEKGAELNLEILKLFKNAFEKNEPQIILEKVSSFATGKNYDFTKTVSDFVQKGHSSKVNLSPFIQNFPKAANITLKKITFMKLITL